MKTICKQTSSCTLSTEIKDKQRRISTSFSVVDIFHFVSTSDKKKFYLNLKEKEMGLKIYHVPLAR